MAHVVFAAPAIAHWHLHERLARALQARGHRVTVLSVGPVEAAFFAEQGLPAARVRPGRGADIPLPVLEWAELEGRWRGWQRVPGRVRDRIAWRLDRVAGGVLRFLEVDPPDLVLLHQRRTGVHRLVHFLAQEIGCRLLWTGEGLLPHTLQWDDEGIDGDSSQCRRIARDFRGVRPDEVFLASALAALLGRSQPVPLARQPFRVPGLLRRLGAALRAGDPAGIGAWRAAFEHPPPVPQPHVDPPGGPFVAVLLQSPGDARLTVDAPHAGDARALVRAVHSAARAWDPSLPVVAVLPPEGLPRRVLAVLRRAGVRLERAEAAPECVVAATAVVTVNHPLAVGGLLAGTPVLHTGRTPYGVRGVARRSTLDLLPVDLPRVLEDDQPGLRARFLTWLLAHGHLWCSAAHPDHNGINGFVQEIEARLHGDRLPGRTLRYRAGPAWPLTAG